MDKSILDVVHHGTKDLHEAGVVDGVTLREFDTLCLPPIQHYSQTEIKKFRENIKISQGVFATYPNTSKSTIQKWGGRCKKTNGIFLKLLNIVGKKGLDVLF